MGEVGGGTLEDKGGLSSNKILGRRCPLPSLEAICNYCHLIALPHPPFFPTLETPEGGGGTLPRGSAETRAKIKKNPVVAEFCKFQERTRVRGRQESQVIAFPPPMALGGGSSNPSSK